MDREAFCVISGSPIISCAACFHVSFAKTPAASLLFSSAVACPPKKAVLPEAGYWAR
jgi:hypothetical protein